MTSARSPRPRTTPSGSGRAVLTDVVRLPFETAPGGRTGVADYAAALRDPSGVTALPPSSSSRSRPRGRECQPRMAPRGPDLAREVGALFIIDDIQAGVGRTGGYFSFDGMDLDPDIITLAKGLGGFGTPIAMNLNKPEVDAHWSPGAHTGTFRGQGLSFLAGTVALDYFTDEAFLADVLAKGQTMRERLTALTAAHPEQDWEVRGRGMMQALDTGDGAFAKQVQQECFERGLLIGPCGSGGRVIKLIPPLTIPEEDLHEGLALEQAVDAAAGRLMRHIKMTFCPRCERRLGMRSGDAQARLIIVDREPDDPPSSHHLAPPSSADRAAGIGLRDDHPRARGPTSSPDLAEHPGPTRHGDAILGWSAPCATCAGRSRVGYERSYFPAYQQDRFHDAFGEGLVDCGIVEDGRVRLEEIEVMQLAAYAGRRRWSRGAAAMAGATENDVAAAISAAMFRPAASSGGDAVRRPGPRSMIGHPPGRPHDPPANTCSSRWAAVIAGITRR